MITLLKTVLTEPSKRFARRVKVIACHANGADQVHYVDYDYRLTPEANHEAGAREALRYWEAPADAWWTSVADGSCYLFTLSCPATLVML